MEREGVVINRMREQAKKVTGKVSLSLNDATKAPVSFTAWTI